MSVLSAATQQQVEDSIVNEKILTAEQLESIKTKARQQHVPFMSLLVKEKNVSGEQLTRLVAQSNNLPYVNLSDVMIDPSILELLPLDIAKHYMAVPLGEMQHRLVVAMLDASNVQAVDFLSNKIGRPLKVYAASEEGITRILKQYEPSLGQEVAGAISDIDRSSNVLEQVKVNEINTDVDNNEKNIRSVSQDSPISQVLSAILEYAAKNRASDVHIEPRKDMLKIRCRIDGVLREIMKLPKNTEAPLVSRIKILSNLKIDEHRIPQDGQFTLHVGGREIDLRIAISPVVWGEQIVIRLLDKTSTSLKIEDLGYGGRALRTIRESLKLSSGMILTSGPTGSGKTTSLYALLQEVKSDSINIVTLEDPVEYKMEGINQIQVNPEVGLTFATGLRSILRQDPDVVMVGEIRDQETAELAVQAALTGHLVFSTLHTNSAAGILPRLLDMNIEPFLIASTVRTVIGQRLVRRIGDKHETYKSDVAETASIKETIGKLLPATEAEVQKVCDDLGFQSLPLRDQSAYTLNKGIDSSDTPGGYKGRLGIYEVFNITDEIQQLILKRSTSSEIQKAAIQHGMVTMREDGYLKALAGYTTLNEANRVAASNSA